MRACVCEWIICLLERMSTSIDEKVICVCERERVDYVLERMIASIDKEFSCVCVCGFE